LGLGLELGLGMEEAEVRREEEPVGCLPREGSRVGAEGERRWRHHRVESGEGKRRVQSEGSR